MSEPRILRFYLETGLRESAAEGRHNFIGKIAAVAEGAGYRVEYRPDTPAERAAAATRPGYAMVHMTPPHNDRALTFRRVYHYPFWAIEAHAERWLWRVAQSEFPQGDVPRQEAERFFAFWGQRLFGDAPTRTAREGFVYVPLQGRLLEHRSFQSCAPLDMLRQILRHETRRRIVATLHPKECHAPADLAALDRLAEREPRLTLTRGAMEPLLQACDYVATQNSSAAFAGYFFRKPAVLFARVDFHHIAANVTALGAEAALRRAPELEPDYAGYLHWFWQEMSINAGRPEAEAKILAALQRHGWPT